TLGLMKAADRYDERLGYKFSTYATWWVRQSIRRAIEDKSATIRLPAHVHTLRDRVRVLQLRFRAEQGREPTDAELARGLDLSPEMLRAVLEAAHEPMSISSEPATAEDLSLEDSLPETAGPSPLATVKEHLRAGELEAALGHLATREADVLRMRYGLGCDPMTLDAAGRKLGLTRERVRQIELKAIKKLRAPQVAGRLKDYWGSGQ
ncbi:sigma-70 family RNA polymerase sigma factor, partial [bacterium]